MNSSIFLSDRVTHSEPPATVQIADLAKKLKESDKIGYDFSAGRAFEPTLLIRGRCHGYAPTILERVREILGK